MKTLKQIREAINDDHPDHRSHSLKMSGHDQYRIHMAIRKQENDDTKPETMSVPTSHIRATQKTVHKDYTPKRKSDNARPVGVRTPDGAVHLYDGHHRTNWQHEHGDKKIAVDVYHDPLDRDYKWRKRGGKDHYE